MRTRRAAVVGLLAFVGLVSACSAQPSVAATTTPSIPTGWRLATLTGLGMSYALPSTWSPVNLPSVRDQLATAVSSGTVTGEIARAWSWIRDQIDAGLIISVTSGPSTVTGYTDSIYVVVLDNSLELRAAVDAAWADAPHSLIESITVDRAVHLPAGDMVLRQTTSEPQGGAPSQTVNYFVLLDHERLLWLSATAPSGESSFPPFIASIAETLARR